MADFCCDLALSVFASKGHGTECHTVKPAQREVGHNGWEDSLVVRIELCCMPHPHAWPICVFEARQYR